jgi:hypothetical protein
MCFDVSEVVLLLQDADFAPILNLVLMFSPMNYLQPFLTP